MTDPDHATPQPIPGGAALLVTGTGSDAGKSTLVAGLCRAVRRQGLSVAPFKAQNMALNSAVTADGREIGRAQALQALACGLEPTAAMNPVLLKPTGERTSQVVVCGHPLTVTDARAYGDLTATLRPVVAEALAELRATHDLVLAEGAGSPAEINLRHRDLANMGLAEQADLPVVLVGDIERGGVFASLYGTWALLDDADRARLRGFVINRFRGDPSLLEPGLAELERRTGLPTLGVVPWLPGLHLEAEDSLGIADRDGGPPLGADGLEVAVLRLPRISNFTDVDALGVEPGVAVTFTASPAAVRGADLVVVPGTKATTDDLDWLRRHRLDRALHDRVAAGGPVLGICGGHQMLGRRIIDDVEGTAGMVPGLGLLPHETVFAPEKVLRRMRGTSATLGGVTVSGYEIRHGRLTTDDADDPVQRTGPVLGTSWHGLLEGDEARRALLAWVAERRRLDFDPGRVSWRRLREESLDRLADALEAALDVDRLVALAAGRATGTSCRSTSPPTEERTTPPRSST